MAGKKVEVQALGCLIVMVLLCGVAAAPAGDALPPYVGVIRNHSSHNLSIPSQNSFGTLIIPARGWMEFVLWEPQAELTCYLEGRPYGCHRVKVTPRGIPLFCRQYDFVVDITPPASELEKETSRPKYQKRVRRKKSG